MATQTTAFSDVVSAAIVQAAGSIVVNITARIADPDAALRKSDEIMGTVMAQLVKHAKTNL